MKNRARPQEISGTVTCRATRLKTNHPSEQGEKKEKETTLSLCCRDSGTAEKKKPCRVPGDVSENVKLPANAA